MGSLIKEQFLQKKRYANLIFILQLFAFVVISIWLIFSKTNYYALDDAIYHSYWQAVFQSNVNLVIYADLAFAVLSSWQNEKINNSQTWNLIPMSSSKLWLGNILSSILTCIYLFIMQLVFLFVTALPHFSAKNPFKHVLDAFGLWPSRYMWQIVGWRILFIFLIAFWIYTFVSFVDFSAKAIVDHLPVKNTLWIRMLVIAILTIIAIYFASIFMGHFESFVSRQYEHRVILVDPLSWDDLIVFIADIIFGLLDVCLFTKYVESKADR